MKIRQRFTVNLLDDDRFISYVKRKKTGLEKKALSINTIALGSSHSDYAFYSPMLQNSYNLGLTSADLYVSYYLYEKNKGILENLKYIILFFSVFSTGNSLIKTSERYRSVSYKFFFDIPYPNIKYIKKRFEKRIYQKCQDLMIEDDHSDFFGYTKKTYFGVNLPVIDRVKTHLRENKREPDQLEWLKKLSVNITHDNRKLIIVIPPCRDDYKKLLPPKSELFNKIYKLGLKDVDFLDLYDSDLFTNEDMGDTDHLNESGAIKLTSEVVKLFKEKGYCDLNSNIYL